MLVCLQIPRLASALAICVLVLGCAGSQPVPSLGCAKDSDCRYGRICSARGSCAYPPKPKPTDAAPAVVGNWSPPFAMFGGNAQHTGQLLGEAPTEAPTQVWAAASESLRQPCRGACAIVGSPTVGPNGTIYFTSHDGRLHAVDNKGVELWSFRTGDRVWSTPAVTQDNTVYIGSDDDHLYSIDGKTGKENWRYRIGQCSPMIGSGAQGPEGARCDVDGGPTLGPDGTVYTGGDGVYAVWPDGRLRWKFATPAHVRSAPALAADGTVYAGCLDNMFYAIRTDGTKAWQFRTGGDIESSALALADGAIIFGSDDKRIYALGSDGTLLWKVITEGPVRGTAALGVDGTIYIGSHDSHFYAINRDGTVRWRFRSGDRVQSTPAVFRDGTVIFGGQDAQLYALAPKDGSLRWYLSFPDDVDVTPTVTPSGLLLVAGDDGHLRAFK